ncbi:MULTISPECIES: HAD family hydrolase [Actinotignum]|uniref:HAD family hydrolase n=1 Tax=Actinotignum TaxID=1653174 RepID=UPI00040ACD4F|nr:HAD family hydrolase [Actinotignum schaalii]AIE83051.1 HAD family hydrolase [Actinotignum schaalii]WQN45208.1 HAD family hydrolase [Actinotignum schaalii]
MKIQVESTAARLRAAFDAAGTPPAGPELMVCLDLDGTTLRPDGIIAERVDAAFQEHLRRGTHLVVATGRGRESAIPVLDMLRVSETIMVCSNGNETVLLGNAQLPGVQVRTVRSMTDRGDVVPVRLAHLFTMEEADLARALDAMRREFPGAYFAVEPVEGPRRVAHGYATERLEPNAIWVKFKDLVVPDALRLIMVVPRMEAAELMARLSRLDMPGVDWAASSSSGSGWVDWAASSSSGSGWVDAGRAGISKASALEVLRRDFGIARGGTVAVGDGGNDIQMLEWAGVGVAMGQALDYVRAHARAVTDPVWDDGVATLLEVLLAR